jgi:hypothetical protein
MFAIPAPARARCEVPTSCRPASASGKESWPAVIRAITAAGVELTLGRRFERGAGLAIMLPAEDGTSSVVLARVTGLGPFGAGWRLACTFISELSEEEVEQVRHIDPAYRASLGGDSDTVNEANPPNIPGVLFQVHLPFGQRLRWVVRQLDLAANWPVAAGKTVTLGISGPEGELPPLELTVRSCRLCGEHWVVDAAFASPPADEVLSLLIPPAG